MTLPPWYTYNFIFIYDITIRETDEAGLGVVVRDHQGRVMATSMSEKIKLSSSLNEVEALAAVRAISFTLELHLPSVIVEGDSELIISALQSEEESFTSFGHLISLIKQSLGIFSCISFSHTRRTGNSLAHNLTQYTRHIDALTVWMEDVPPQLHHVLITDFGWFNKVSSAWFSKKKNGNIKKLICEY